jgi:segregation and condensation protein B
MNVRSGQTPGDRRLGPSAGTSFGKLPAVGGSDTGGITAGPAATIPLKPALEAILMVVDEPATEPHLAAVLERPRSDVAKALRELAAEYTAQRRGFELRLVAGGWRYYTRSEYAPAVERFVLDGRQARLTQAALETLAVVAYRQPVSRSRVSAVRGVNCDGVMRTLMTRGLVEEAGIEPGTGAVLYRTTNHFLERMGLRGLDELPELTPFLPEAGDVEAESQEGPVPAGTTVEAGDRSLAVGTVTGDRTGAVPAMTDENGLRGGNAGSGTAGRPTDQRPTGHSTTES